MSGPVSGRNRREKAALTCAVNLMDKEGLKEVREAVNQELPVLAALRSERDELHKRLINIQAELDEHKSLLTVSLIDRDMVHKSLLDHKDDLRVAEKEQNIYKLALEKAKQAGGIRAEDRPTTETDARLAQLYQENENLKQQLADIAKVNDNPLPPSPLRIVKKDTSPVDVFGTTPIPASPTLSRQQYIGDQERVVKNKQQLLESPSDEGRSDVTRSRARALLLSPDDERPLASLESSAPPAVIPSSEAALPGREPVSASLSPATSPAEPPTAGHERWRAAANLDTSASQVPRPTDPLALFNHLTSQLLTLTTLLVSRERIQGLDESQSHNHTHHHHSHHTHFHCQSPMPTPTTTTPPQPCSPMHVHQHPQPPK